MENNQFEAGVPPAPSTVVGVQDAEDMQFKKAEVMDCSTDEYSGSEDSSGSSSIERTSSQAAALAQIQSVFKKLEERRVAVQELQVSVASLIVEGDVPSLERSQAQVDVARKQARNLGEDLLEDLLALDGLSGLITEDRSSRKTAVAGIEALLEEVDASKARLVDLQKRVQISLEAARTKQHELEVQETEAETQETPRDPRCIGSISAEKEVLPGQRCPKRQVRQQQLRAPERDLWENLARPVEFQSRQERSTYAILAAVPGLNAEDLKIRLSDDRSTLAVTGLCIPTAHQAEQMRQKLAAQLQHFARTSPQRFRQLSSKLDKVAAQTYAELGEGKFGSFSETFRVPSDIDPHCIKASLDDGILRIILPKKTRQVARPMTARQPFGQFGNAGLWDHPGFNW